MSDIVKNYVNKVRRDRAARARFFSVALTLSILVVVGVVWSLRLTGISMTDDGIICGIEEHEHTSECYQKELICHINEGDHEYVDEVDTGILHEHKESCYSEELVCSLEEHYHGIECIDLDDEGWAGLLAGVSPYNGDNTFTKQDGTVIELDTIYVDTVTGERHKDKITEYLDNAYPANVVKERHPQMVDNNNYIKNFYYPGEYNSAEPGTFWLRMPSFDEEGNHTRKGETVKLVYYTENWNGKYRVANYWGNEWHTMSGFLEFSEPKVTTVDGTNGKQYQRVEIEVTCIAGASQGNTFVRVEIGRDYTNPDNNTNSEDSHNADNLFYIYGTRGKTYDHADIEISDGGSFKVITIRSYENSSRVDVIETEYKSYVSEVHNSKIYYIGDAVDSPSVVYESKDYRKKGAAEMGGQLTQLEFTSQGTNSGKRYDEALLEKVVFNIDIDLQPNRIVSARQFNSIDEYRNGGTGTDISSTIALGKDHIIVENFDYELNSQSILDAKTKCPNHTGMDFNIIATELEVVVTPPANITFNALKTLDNSEPGSAGPFKFELYEVVKERESTGEYKKDSSGNIITHNEKVEEVTADSFGNVKFTAFEFLIPADKEYRVKEVIPSGANSSNDYKYDGIKYDNREHTIKVDVKLDDTFRENYESSYGAGESKQFTQNLVTMITVDGKVIDTVGNNGSGYPYSLNSAKLKFDNETYDYDEKTLLVKKEWDDSASVNHDDDKIVFRVWQNDGNNETALTVNGATLFELNSNNGWTKDFGKIKTRIGQTNYSFRIEEITTGDYKPVYGAPQVTDNSYTLTVSNMRDSTRLDIEKVWDKPSDAMAPDSIEVELTREYHQKLVPVRFIIMDGEAIVKEMVWSAYYNGYLGMGINSNGIRPTVRSATNCTASINDDKDSNNNKLTDGRLDVQNIKPGAVVIIDSPAIDESTIIAHVTKGSDYDNVTATGDGVKNGCYSTCYTNNSGLSTIQIKDRTAAWNGLEFPVDLVAGQTYSVSAYGMWKKPVYSGVYSKNVSVKLTLCYDLNGTADYKYIAETGNIEHNQWKQMKNINFTVPDNATNIRIKAESTESDAGTNSYMDLFVDDLVIANAGYDYEVIKSNAKVTNTIRFKDPYTPNNGWKLDTEFTNNTFTITKDDDWKRTLLESDLSENPYYEYRYTIEEKQTGLDAYRVSYENNTSISSTNADYPVKITNTYIAYTLPSTGGIGAEKLRLVGLITLAGGTFILLLARMYKRKKISQTK